MTVAQTLTKLSASTVVGMLTMGASYQAVEAVQSFHGDDYSQDYNDRLQLRVCDREGDSNPIKGGVSFNSERSEQDTVHNGDGSGTCATGGPWWSGPPGHPAVPITQHHTCEQNHIVWDCNNWQATTK